MFSGTSGLSCLYKYIVVVPTDLMGVSTIDNGMVVLEGGVQRAALPRRDSQAGVLLIGNSYNKTAVQSDIATRPIYWVIYVHEPVQGSR